MSAKKQALVLAVIDRRTAPPQVRKFHFKDHNSFLIELAKQVSTDGIVHEVTQTVLTIYPQSQAILFDQ